MAKYNTKEGRMYLRIRNLCGILGVSLPWLALFSSGIAEHPGNDWWWSISATYYQSPALVGVLVPAAMVLISYIGYDNTDNFLTSLAGIFGLDLVNWKMLFMAMVRKNSPAHATWTMWDISTGIWKKPTGVPSGIQLTLHGKSTMPSPKMPAREVRKLSVLS